MGNCTSKSKRGEVLGSAPSSNQQQQNNSTYSRRNDTANNRSAQGSSVGGGGPTDDRNPRAAAAQAAEARMNQQANSGGELSAKLNKERNKNKTQLLKDASISNSYGRNDQLVYD